MILFFLLLANNVFSMEFTPLEELKLLPIDPAVVKAFSTSNASLSEFVLAWRQRAPAQKRFMVCELERRQDRQIPVGGRIRCQEPFFDIWVEVCWSGWLWEEQSERQLVV